MRSIFIEARQWWDKSGGNTYYSARVSIDGVWLYTTGLRYGYEYQYEDDVAHDLANAGVIPVEARDNLRRYCRDNGIDFYSVRYEAPRRKLWKSEGELAPVYADGLRG
jgi:hypothetical protein